MFGTAMNLTPYISKSKFLHGLQCPKLLWCDYNAKHLFPDGDDALQYVFDQGHEVGAFAERMFPTGTKINAEPGDFKEAIELTKRNLASRRPIFEATLSASGGYARADILNPVAKNEWDIIEVKSTTGLKEVHIPDLAFQAWVFAEAGLNIRGCFLCHINNQFSRHGEIDPQELFTLRDVTAEVSEFSHDIGDQIVEMGKIIRAAKCPEIQIGKHCDSPYTCALNQHCWSFLPNNSIFDLYNDQKGRRWDLLNRNILQLADIPEDFALSANQEIQRSAVVTGKPHIKKSAIKKFLQNLEYPLHFLDFETFSTAIPMFDGTRPYEQIPFQFSLHIVRKPGMKPEHREFLAEGRNDPREEFMRQLNLSVESAGSILVFNASFEKSRMKECAEVLPQYQSWVSAVNGRIVDLLNPFKAFNYYHPNQGGSASMKKVLPALTGKDYTSLEIQEGGAASREFMRVTFGDVSEAERKRVRLALEKYCGLDTEGMAWILDALSAT